MIREAILQKLDERKITQARICEDLGVTKQNFSSFLTGRQTLPYQTAVAVCQYLNLTIGEVDKAVAHTKAMEIPKIISRRLASMGVTLKNLSERCQINPSTISCFLNGKRNICVSNLEKILKALKMGVVDYGPQLKKKS